MSRSRKPRPLCSALLKDGSACRTWAGSSGLCKFHELQESEPVAVEPEADEPADVVALELPAGAEEALAVAPGQLRERFAADAAASYNEMVGALQAAMGHAEKSSMLTCRKCGARDVYAGPDHKTRADAVEKWVGLGFGKVKEQPVREKIDGSLRRIRELSDEQLAAIADGPADIAGDAWDDELPPAA